MARHKNKTGSWFARHKIFSAVSIIVLSILVLIVGFSVYNSISSSLYQASLQPFYTPPDPLPPQPPGYIMRYEPMNIDVPGGTAYRILYLTQGPTGEKLASSGMIFVPNTPAPPEGRKVVAWAHGTLGFGDACTPSRNQTNPLNDMQGWLGQMMQNGWVVTATDYAGLGTPGDPYYLVGASEAHDVLNSVRAARNFAPAQASNKYALWGHSQGGHSVLFSAEYAKSYAPELNLVGAAAAAPAAELPALFSEQYNQAVAWAIGPDVAISWPLVYPNLDIQSVLTPAGINNYHRLAFGCVQQEIGGIELRNFFKQQFFSTNPIQTPSWYKASTEQTPNTSQIGVPVYVAQGLSDTVVLPNTTALLVQKACANNVNVTTNWLENVNHLQVAIDAGPAVTNWLQDRFNGVSAQSSCSQQSPISPASQPAVP